MIFATQSTIHSSHPLLFKRNGPTPIVFAENSDCDISEHFTEAIVNERLECLTFKSNYDKEWGKGLGESLIIEYALSHSCLLSASSIILKITGRIQIANIKVLLKATPPSQDTIFTDYSTKKGEQNLLKSVIVQAPIDFWKLFLDYKKDINDSQGIYFEHILKYAADKWYTNGHEYTYFPYPIYGLFRIYWTRVQKKASLSELVYQVCTLSLMV